jgi:hypothetical protein
MIFGDHYIIFFNTKDEQKSNVGHFKACMILHNLKKKIVQRIGCECSKQSS